MEYNFRTLNYLGSKLRLLDFIESKIQEVTPADAGVCDLFTGSGCVSYKLSKNVPVLSCDIQGYSQVICNALLKKYNVSVEFLTKFFAALDSDYATTLKRVFKPLVTIEQTALANKDSVVLTCILEHGSIEVFSIEKEDSLLVNDLQQVSMNLVNAGLGNERSLISRYYGGVYFSYQQAIQIDIILDAIHQYVPEENKDLFLAALLSTASDIVDTVGKHFAQPIKARDSKGNIKSIVYNKVVKDKTVDALTVYKEWLHKYMTLPKSGKDYAFFQGDYADCLRTLPGSIKTIYADPPYTRDHYSRFYHVLETMTLRDMPELSTVTAYGSTHISNGIYRKDRHQSPFCIRSKALDAFRTMFDASASADRNLLLSYSPYDETKKSHPRVVTMQQLTDLAGKYFNRVEIVSAGHFTHNKLNSTEHFLESSDEAEVLIVCTNE